MPTNKRIFDMYLNLATKKNRICYINNLTFSSSLDLKNKLVLIKLLINKLYTTNPNSSEPDILLQSHKNITYDIYDDLLIVLDLLREKSKYFLANVDYDYRKTFIRRLLDNNLLIIEDRLANLEKSLSVTENINDASENINDASEKKQIIASNFFSLFDKFLIGTRSIINFRS